MVTLIGPQALSEQYFCSHEISVRFIRRIALRAVQSDHRGVPALGASAGRSRLVVAALRATSIYEDMTGAVRNLKDTTRLASATGALVFASFIYGIFHALGPGHGKAVIRPTCLPTSKLCGAVCSWRSLMFVQALSAIALVAALSGCKATGLATASSKHGWRR